ncbi:MAG: NEK kinase [Lasallia pustulata]|uniref:non-specific serine/threonine protein kinase n=1 Tax=Lasallia pustulata TaxID=136370 RepID=A0A5M8PYK2_9LECA|nr:MAG: NEK kinase [Lasallia pustulata]
MPMTSLWFMDYNSEGHLTRRLNEAGCRNVIKVLEWAYLEPKPSPWHDMSFTSLPEEPKFRIAYEVADHGDLQQVVKWYQEHNLIFPEAFIWHIFYSIANALCYCALGWNESPERATGWEEIVHGDLKPGNILLTDPEEGPSGLYPTAKLADFGTCIFPCAHSYNHRGPLMEMSPESLPIPSREPRPKPAN